MDSSGLYVNRWKKIPNMFQLECGSSVYLGESIIVQDLESRTFQVNTSISVDQNFPNFVTATESFRRIRYNIFDLPFFLAALHSEYMYQWGKIQLRTRERYE